MPLNRTTTCPEQHSTLPASTPLLGLGSTQVDVKLWRPISTLLKHGGEEPSPFPQVWGLGEKRKQIQPRVPERKAEVKCERAPGSGTVHENTWWASSVISHLLPGASSGLGCGWWWWGIKKYQVHPQVVSVSTSGVWESTLWFLHVSGNYC